MRRDVGKFRFFHAGEYGDKEDEGDGDVKGRPHLHACIFGLDFREDRKFLRLNKNGDRLYTSQTLNDVWGKGFDTVGDVTFQSAAYVARYIMKKRTGPLAETHYNRVNHQTGEVTSVKPEYTTMSRRPGIGKEWYQKYKRDVFPDDFVVINGTKMRTPNYYLKQLEQTDADAFAAIAAHRQLRAEKQAKDNTPERLAVKEVIAEAKIAILKRPIE